MAKGNNPIEENNALMANGRGVPDSDDTFAKFLFNKERGTCCGRNTKSWFQIIVFYIIFYACLSAFWLACLAIFLRTLDDKVPRFYGKGTIIGINPGVGYQPWIKENPDSTLIKFNLRDETSWKPYVNQLEGYLGKYKNTNNTRECGEGESNADFNNEGGENIPACQFSLDVFEKAGCSTKTQFGYKSGKPCVILSLNRLIGWRPVDFAPDSVPEPVKDRYKNGSIALHCDGTNPVDKEHIGKVNYLPAHGIDGKYYPYAVMPNYHQPIAMVKFDTLPRNKLVLVECRAYALNVEHDITARLGLVHFEILVQDKTVEKKPVQ